MRKKEEIRKMNNRSKSRLDFELINIMKVHREKIITIK